MTNLSLTVVGIIGNITSFILYLSPLPTIWYICKKRSTEKFSPFPYTFLLLSCLFWAYYGSPMVKRGLLITTINALGSLFQVFFISAFLIFAVDWKTRLRTLQLVSFVLLVYATVVACTMFLIQNNRSKRILSFGSVSVCTSIMRFASPPAIMRMVIVERNTQYMPIYFTMGAFANAGIWTLYGILSLDKFVIIPNSLGTLLSIVQIILHILYYKNTRRLREQQLLGDIENPSKGEEERRVSDVKNSDAKRLSTDSAKAIDGRPRESLSRKSDARPIDSPRRDSEAGRMSPMPSKPRKSDVRDIDSPRREIERMSPMPPKPRKSDVRPIGSPVGDSTAFEFGDRSPMLTTSRRSLDEVA